ncbi:MAG: hybrid sensor histidine kinase/response regulator, partial [Rhodobacterales bacterium]|nr:hybrid sensor histidine kinase/response regulator [Rhodobacterales bacterium]
MTDSQHNPQDEADQITRQRAALMQEAPLRMLAGAVAYGIAMLLLPPLVVIACAAVDIGTEIAVMRIMRRPARLLRGPGRWVYLAGSALIEAAFLLPAALAWHVPNPLAMVFAVGMMCGSMLQITTVRAIHLPMGLTGAATVAVMALASNVLQWRGPGELGELAASSVAILAFAGYAISALVSNRGLHRSAALARQRAEAADAANGRFLAQMSHELRTPLNAILGMGRAVQVRTADPVNRDRIATLLRAAEGLAAMLDDILDLTAVQEGRLPLRPRPCDPRDEIATTLALFQPRAEELGLTLTLDLDPAIPARATFDPQRLRQCLSNLLSNALKATAEGGIRVEATIAAQTDAPQIPGPQILQIIVADTGPGVPAHRRADLFDGTGPGRGGAAGHGLGLSIARA